LINPSRLDQIKNAETVLMQQHAVQEAGKALDELSSILSDPESTIVSFDFILKSKPSRKRDFP
jgi:hypothetical protein